MTKNLFEPVLWMIPTAILFALPAFAGTDYLEPTNLTGNIYEISSGTNTLLYTFHRTAHVANGIVRVSRNYFNPDGSAAVVEKAVFDHGALVSFFVDDFQTGARGLVTVTRDPNKPARKNLSYEWSTTAAGKTKNKSATEALQPDTFVSDMVPYFIETNFDKLERGESLQLRCIVPERLETIGFTLSKDSETTWRGKKVLRLRMQASSFLVARFIDPFYFMVEKAAPHHVLEYTGRVAPKLRKGDEWKDLDARSIYGW